MALLAVAVSGCATDDVLGADGSIGALGEGFFSYLCVDDGDAVCNQTEAVNTAAVDLDLGEQGALPTSVAVGARFDLDYFGDISAANGEILFLEVVPARRDKVRSGGGFVIDEAGMHAFLSRSPKGFTADFAHIDARQIATLDVWRAEETINAIDIVEGREIELAVTASDDLGIALAGAIPYAWSSSDEEIVRIGKIGTIGTPGGGVEHNDDEIRLVALGAGSATITVKRDEIESIIDITVEADAGEGEMP